MSTIPVTITTLKTQLDKKAYGYRAELLCCGTPCILSATETSSGGGAGTKKAQVTANTQRTVSYTSPTIFNPKNPSTTLQVLELSLKAGTTNIVTITFTLNNTKLNEAGETKKYEQSVDVQVGKQNEAVNLRFGKVGSVTCNVSVPDETQTAAIRQQQNDEEVAYQQKEQERIEKERAAAEQQRIAVETAAAQAAAVEAADEEAKRDPRILFERQQQQFTQQQLEIENEEGKVRQEQVLPLLIKEEAQERYLLEGTVSFELYYEHTTEDLFEELDKESERLCFEEIENYKRFLLAPQLRVAKLNTVDADFEEIKKYAVASMMEKENLQLQQEQEEENEEEQENEEEEDIIPGDEEQQQQQQSSTPRKKSKSETSQTNVANTTNSNNNDAVLATIFGRGRQAPPPVTRNDEDMRVIQERLVRQNLAERAEREQFRQDHPDEEISDEELFDEDDFVPSGASIEEMLKNPLRSVELARKSTLSPSKYNLVGRKSPSRRRMVAFADQLKGRPVSPWAMMRAVSAFKRGIRNKKRWESEVEIDEYGIARPKMTKFEMELDPTPPLMTALFYLNRNNENEISSANHTSATMNDNAMNNSSSIYQDPLSLSPSASPLRSSNVNRSVSRQQQQQHPQSHHSPNRSTVHFSPDISVIGAANEQSVVSENQFRSSTSPSPQHHHHQHFHQQQNATNISPTRKQQQQNIVHHHDSPSTNLSLDKSRHLPLVYDNNGTEYCSFMDRAEARSSPQKLRPTLVKARRMPLPTHSSGISEFAPSSNENTSNQQNINPQQQSLDTYWNCFAPKKAQNLVGVRIPASAASNFQETATRYIDQVSPPKMVSMHPSKMIPTAPRNFRTSSPPSRNSTMRYLTTSSSNFGATTTTATHMNSNSSSNLISGSALGPQKELMTDVHDMMQGIMVSRQLPSLGKGNEQQQSQPKQQQLFGSSSFTSAAPKSPPKFDLGFDPDL